MASTLQQRGQSRHATTNILDLIIRNLGGPFLPAELVTQINDYLHPAIVPLSMVRALPHPSAAHPALNPPANGRSMLEELPIEVKRKVLAYFLPSKNVTVQPLCQQHSQAQDPMRIPKRNTVSDLMCISKKFQMATTRCMYAERFFTIHVHEGIHDGGIEFLDTGRQPLHYKSTICDTRFTRFDDGAFGFAQLKKIEIIIHPSAGAGRHCAMTTYYINHALVRMLERSGVDDRIVSLTIKFAKSAQGTTQASHTRRQIASSEHAWWNHEINEPRTTSIHGITDVELALRPFAMLTTVHNVHIELPAKVKKHDATVRFTNDLERSMKSNTCLGTLGPNDELERHAEIMRDEIETFIFNDKHGHKGDGCAKMTEHEWHEDEVHNDVEVNENPGISEGEWRNLQGELKSFTGVGRSVGSMTSGPKTTLGSSNRELFRTMRSTTATKKGSRVSWTDSFTMDAAGSKRTVEDPSDLEVIDLTISDAESEAKTIKHNAADSPGRSRVTPADEDAVSFTTTMSSLARDRESRRLAHQMEMRD